jgi:hypothetical protein
MQEIMESDSILSNFKNACVDGHILMDLLERRAEASRKCFALFFDIYRKLDQEFELTQLEREACKNFLLQFARPEEKPISRELCISEVCKILGVSSRGKCAEIGKRMAIRWKDAHPGAKPQKKKVKFRNKEYWRNVYYESDFALLAKVIKEVVYPN